MRAADVLLDLDDEQCALSTDIALTRVRLREARGPVPTLLQADGVVTVPAVGDGSPEDQGARELATLRELVQRRAAAGGPLPPGNCGVEIEPVSGRRG